MLVFAVAIAAACSNASGDDTLEKNAAAPQAACHDAALLGQLGELREASGLAASRRNENTLWAHNDSAAPVLYAIGFDGRVRGRVHLKGAQVEDWEAVTVATCAQGSCLFVADIGDNNAARQRITIYRVREPAASDQVTEPVEALHLAYPDGAQDAESLFATADGTLFIVTKGERGPVKVYRVPSSARPGAVSRLEPVVSLTADNARKTNRVTDAATSPDGGSVVLRTGETLHFYKMAELTSGRAPAALDFDVRMLNEPQGEGVAWTKGNTLYLAGEGGRGGTLARVSCDFPTE